MYRARKQVGNHPCWLQKGSKMCRSGCKNFQGSLRKPASQVQMSSSNIQRAFRKLHQCPYCIRAVRELTHTDTAEQLTVPHVVLVFPWGNWDKRAWYGLLWWWSMVPSWKIHKQTSKKQKSTHTHKIHKKNPYIYKKKLAWSVCCLADIQFIPRSLWPQSRVCEDITMEFISMLGFIGCY